MYKCVIKLAKIPIGISYNYEENEIFFKLYETNEKPIVNVSIDIKDTIDEENPPYMERLLVYRDIVEKLLPYNVLLLHGAAVSIDNKGIIFSAPSGTGKTTHIKLWKEVYGDRFIIINGDKPLIKFEDEGIYVYGTPWQGKENYGSNTYAKLEAICFLNRSGQNSIERIRYDESIPKLFHQSYNPKTSEGKIKRMELISKMKDIQFYSLNCNMEPDAAKVAYEGICD